MATARQIDANRANSKRSTGPRTEAGKTVARQNSLQHGLTSQTIVRERAEDEAYDAYSASMLPVLAPANAFELDLARRVIHDSWRLNRAGAFEDNILCNATHKLRSGTMADLQTEDNRKDHALAQSRAYCAEAGTLDRLTLYQQRIQRSFERNFALLKSLQKERLATRLTHSQSARSPRPAASQPLQTVETAAPSPEIGFVRSAAQASPSSPPSGIENASENMAA